MEQPLPALVFQIFGFAISILALLAESHSQTGVNIPATLVSRMPISPSPVPYHLLPAPLPPPPYHRSRPRSPPPPPEKTINTGKKIGLLFVGIAAILQIGVVGFLAFKRRQVLKLRDSYETSS